MKGLLIPLNDDWGGANLQSYPCLPKQLHQDAKKPEKQKKNAEDKALTGSEAGEKTGRKRKRSAEGDNASLAADGGCDPVIAPATAEIARRSKKATAEHRDNPQKIQEPKKRRKAKGRAVPISQDAPVKVAQKTEIGPAQGELTETSELAGQKQLVQESGKRRRRNRNKFKRDLEEPDVTAEPPRVSTQQESHHLPPVSSAVMGQSQQAQKANKTKSPRGEQQLSLAATEGSPQHSRGLSGRRIFERAGASKLSQRLLGSKFRWLNEKLYTTTGAGGFQLMADEPELFQQYHQGFEEQTKSWAIQPVELVIQWLQKQPKSLRIADFGCGNAHLARSVPQQVTSLDLVASTPEVIACNMSHTPLDSSSVDVVVFCLALMGVDYPSFLAEGKRVLKPGGRMWIAEVRSRFAQSSDGTEDFRPFVKAVESLGFKLQSQSSSKMFVIFVFKLRANPNPLQRGEWPSLKACLYKRR